MQDEALIAIGQGCPLEHLNVSGCNQIGDAGIVAIARGCPQLTYLDVSVLQEVCLLSLYVIVIMLLLMIYSDKNIFFSESEVNFNLIVIFFCLQFLFTTCLSIPLWKNLRDMALAELGEGCPLLKDIVLSHCCQITDFGLSHLVKNCQMLESCHMVYCPSITAAGVATVISSCPHIKKVLVEKWKVSPRTERRSGSVLSYPREDL